MVPDQGDDYSHTMVKITKITRTIAFIFSVCVRRSSKTEFIFTIINIVLFLYAVWRLCIYNGD